MQKKFKENIVKNVILVALLAGLYFPIHSYLLEGNLVSDKTSAGNILIAVSIIAVLAAFGNFGFKYDKVNFEYNSTIKFS